MGGRAEEMISSGSWWDLRSPRKCFALWGGFLLAPLLVNLFVRRSFVHPAQVRLLEAHEARIVRKLEPKLEGLLKQSGEILSRSRGGTFTKQDPSAPIQALRKFGTEQHVQLKDLRSAEPTASQQNDSKMKVPQMLLEVKAFGSFAKLARWIEDVEREPGLAMESLTLKTGPDPSGPQQELEARIAVFMQ